MTGRTALVTGCGSERGIGFACARALAEFGATVAITATGDRVFARRDELRALGHTVHAATADLTDPVAVDRLVTELSAQAGPIDVLVNNAGMSTASAPMEATSGRLVDLSYDTWRTSLDRDLGTAFLVSRSVLPGMVARRWGRIALVASVTGPVGAMQGEAAYAAGKAALVGLAKSIAVDHAADGITANAVAPGWIATASQTDHEARQGRATPIGRSADPAEIGAMVAALCVPAASYVTGQLLTVDGGNSIGEERAIP